MTNVARRFRGPLPAVPVLAAIAVAAAAALPARAQPLPPAAGAATPTKAGQWWLTSLGVAQAWRAIPEKGKGVTVAVLSTGVDGGHPDLAGSVTAGPDYSGSGRHRGGPFWGAEGTAVASLIAGHGHGPGGADGITGIAPGAHILSVQVTVEYDDDQLTGSHAVMSRLPAAIAAGIRYAVGHGATVIALPLDPGTLGAAGGSGGTDGSRAEQAAVGYARSHDVLLIAPAGDNGASTGTINYPAGYPGVIAVGATERNGTLAPFSSTRPYVALTAPGATDTATGTGTGLNGTNQADGLAVAAPGTGYASLASTDMAAAITAGVAALIRARYPWLTAAEVTGALERGAASRQAGSPAPGYGHGALDAARAVTAAAAIAAAHPRPTAPPSPVVSSPAAGQAAGQAGPAAAPSVAPRTASSGSLARSLLIDLVVAAGGLIAIGIGVMLLTGARRRRAFAARSTRRRRSGHVGTHAGAPARGHARPRTPLAIAAPPVERYPPVVPLTAPPRGAFDAASRPGTDPASQPPWELSPADFAPAPPATDPPSWPVTSTGPMYVWNPGSTGPQQILPEEEP